MAQTNEALTGALARIRTPFFLASETADGTELILHTMERRKRRELNRQATAALVSAGIARQVTVAVHRPGRFTRYRSLEALVDSVLGRGAVLFDPTQFVTRADLVVAL